MKTFDDEARARIARGWEESGLDQTTYAANNGIDARTLRLWRARFVAGRQPAEQLRALLQRVRETVDGLLADVDAAAAGERCRAETVGNVQAGLVESATAVNAPVVSVPETPPDHVAPREQTSVANKESPPTPTGVERPRARRRNFFENFS
jgi:hypothetical protein